MPIERIHTVQLCVGRIHLYVALMSILFHFTINNGKENLYTNRNFTPKNCPLHSKYSAHEKRKLFFIELS